MELQQEAQERLMLQRAEDDRKFEGLTPFERKRMILKELKDNEKSGKPPAPIVPPQELVPKKRDSVKKRKTKPEVKEWNFDTEVTEKEPENEINNEKNVSWLAEETKNEPSGIDWLSNKDKEVKPWRDDETDLKKPSGGIAWLGSAPEEKPSNDNTLVLEAFEEETI